MITPREILHILVVTAKYFVGMAERQLESDDRTKALEDKKYEKHKKVKR